MLALLLALLVTPSPAPSVDPLTLPEIGRVRSTYLCAILHQRVVPAIARLNAADASIESGKRTFIDMARNQVAHLGAAFQLDEVRASNDVGAIVKNVSDAGALISDAKDFPQRPASSDGLIANDLKQKLQRVMDAQQLTINVLNGMIETERLGRMQHEGLDTLSGVVGPQTVPISSPSVDPEKPISYLDVAGLPATADMVIDPRSVLASGLAADTLYGKIALAVYGEQGRIANLESILTAAVAPLERGCIR